MDAITKSKVVAWVRRENDQMHSGYEDYRVMAILGYEHEVIPYANVMLSSGVVVCIPMDTVVIEVL